MTTEQKEVLDKIVSDFANDPDIKNTVKSIEDGIKTTQGNYGKYMSFLSQFCDNKTSLMVMSMALVKAGADAFGVASAMRIITGEN